MPAYAQQISALQRRIRRKPGQNPTLRNQLQNARRRQDRPRPSTQGRPQSPQRPQGNPPAPLPYSGQYDTTVGNLQNNLNFTQADIAGQKLGVEQQYGFGMDASNPYSVAKMLERNHAARFAGTGNSYARTGQLYAGSLTRARETDTFTSGVETDTALREYQAKLAELTRGGVAATREFNEGVAGAEADRLEYALNQPVDPLEAPPGNRPNRPGGGGGQGGGSGGGGGQPGNRPPSNTGQGQAGGGGSPGGGPGNKPNINPRAGMMWKYSERERRWIQVRRP